METEGCGDHEDADEVDRGGQRPLRSRIRDHLLLGAAYGAGNGLAGLLVWWATRQ
ncbi:hypothetical protein [Streptomyces violaceusniger]|uniref:Uncharacterized protein n=1 Tax=Streptomyces violaceusniger (strain Tu 4113) TaxID=653045 RepID=G2PGM5_STRV4|nr:hypothetical protein [Streptomyces violaceusniger]AEM88521.1 hypothetical protein Strvi_9232 [Streptomyces violaceusniger Tu 4113]